MIFIHADAIFFAAQSQRELQLQGAPSRAGAGSDAPDAPRAIRVLRASKKFCILLIEQYSF